MLIAIDGPEGAGKSTQAKLLAEYLTSLGKDVIQIREPGSTKTGEQIRAVLLNPMSKISVRAEVLLFMASRAQLYEETILPALRAGQYVVMDRWAWSTMAYQSHGDVSLEQIERITDFAVSARWPHFSIFLDVPVSVGIARLEKKTKKSFGRAKDRFELRSTEYHQWVRDRYKQLALQYRKTSILIESVGDIDEIHRRVREALRSKIK